MSKKGDKDMQAATEDGDGNRGDQLSLKQVHNYTDLMVERGHAEYNKGSILVKSKHPLDQCLRRGIIEQHHHDSGKRIMTIRDCAFSRTSGRIYNDVGDGDGDIDAMTLFVNTERLMRTGGAVRQWSLVKILCFPDPDINGCYFSEADYSRLYGIAPDLQHAFERLDDAIAEARKTIQDRLAKADAVQ